MGNLRRMMAGEAMPQRPLVEVRRKDGRVAFVEPRTHIVRDREGRPIGMLGIYREITDRVQAEMALRDAKDAAEAASRAKSQFLASMSHELRTPLNSVIGFSKVLLNRGEGELTEAQALYIRTMYENSTHLLRLIDEILDIARIEAGKTELLSEDVRVDELVDECVQSSRPLLAGKRVTLEGRAARDLPALFADRTKLKQVLLNIVGNAIKFTASGSSVVTARATAGAVQVSVADTGRGIPAAELPWIFDPFRQVPVPGRATSGVGLGLAICKKFVELHGGRIWVESTEFRGSTFYFTVP
ncbi:MAG: PAS domain S-box protein [Candidatus Rokubacteria bacterium]|nr:PAS domain S-box protein [Candidatus Rokubacteria bacterium]